MSEKGNSRKDLPVRAGRTDTLAKYLTEVWLATTLPQRVKAGRLAESTFDSYRDTVERHIVPHLGEIRLVDLSTTHIRAWLLELAGKPSGPTRKTAQTVAYAHAVLRKALSDAVDDRSIERNVCLSVDPTRTTLPIRPLTQGASSAPLRRSLDALLRAQLRAVAEPMEGQGEAAG